jgi:hypothetical protein
MLGRIGPQPHADHAAERNTGPGEVPGARGIGHRQGITPQALDGVVALGRVRGAVAAHVVADHTEALHQIGHHRVPQRVVGTQRIAQQQHWTVGAAVGAPVQAYAVDVHKWHGFSSSNAGKRSSPLLPGEVSCPVSLLQK